MSTIDLPKFKAGTAKAVAALAAMTEQLVAFQREVEDSVYATAYWMTDVDRRDTLIVVLEAHRQCALAPLAPMFKHDTNTVTFPPTWPAVACRLDPA